jgi:D-alanyl-D-alanine carboxypeptidase/D-alanyl-D-alanine-endopeptidase (penicillin-binding protein 4)
MADARIAARASRRAVRTPAAAAVLAAVSSPPLSAMVRLMNVPSDDLFAELLTKQLGARLRGSGSISAGARVISSTIAAHYGLRPAILDGSGLSRHDRSSPAQVVALLRDLWHTAVGREVIESLPTVGIDGTVASIAVRTAAQGRCVAKTGTLNYVTNLAGYCASLGGHPLAFALFVDGPPNGVAIGLESRIVAAIARY